MIALSPPGPFPSLLVNNLKKMQDGYMLVRMWGKHQNKMQYREHLDMICKNECQVRGCKEERTGDAGLHPNLLTWQSQCWLCNIMLCCNTEKEMSDLLTWQSQALQHNAVLCPCRRWAVSGSHELLMAGTRCRWWVWVINGWCNAHINDEQRPILQ